MGENRRGYYYFEYLGWCRELTDEELEQLCNPPPEFIQENDIDLEELLIMDEEMEGETQQKLIKGPIVICLEGPPAVGKSSTIDKLSMDLGTCMDEGFMKKRKNDPFHPQSYIKQNDWISGWLQRLRDLCIPHYDRVNDTYKDETQIIFTDRSPYSGAIFSKENKRELASHVSRLINKHEEKNLRIITVCLKRHKGTVWKDLLERLQKQPERKKYGEGDREMFEKIWNLYYGGNYVWDYTIKGDFVAEIKKIVQSLQK